MNRIIINHFKAKDPTMYRWALKCKDLKEIKKARPDRYFIELCDAIVGQQLSGKAASSIFAKFKKLFSAGKITPRKVSVISHAKLRTAGLSDAKARYLKYLARAVLSKELPLSKLDAMPDEDVTERLIQVKGIGPWTAEMFLMFTLGRKNIFSFGDLGLKKGILKVYNLKALPSKERLEKVIAKWSPYKSYASRILWKSIEKE